MTLSTLHWSFYSWTTRKLLMNDLSAVLMFLSSLRTQIALWDFLNRISNLTFISRPQFFLLGSVCKLCDDVQYLRILNYCMLQTFLISLDNTSNFRKHSKSILFDLKLWFFFVKQRGYIIRLLTNLKLTIIGHMC